MNCSCNTTEQDSTRLSPNFWMTYENYTNGKTPTIIFLMVLCVLGTIGNAHVLFVFVLKIKTKSTYVTYVTALAFVDFLVSVVSMPLEIILLKNPDNFWNPVTCRLFRYSNLFLLSLSPLVLLVVAMDRYKRVCRTLKKQWTVTFSRKLIGICILTAALLNIPSLIVFGMRNTYIDRNTTIQSCFINDEFKDTYFAVIYAGIICFITLILTGVLIFTYVSMSCVLKRNSLIRVYLIHRLSALKYVRNTFRSKKPELADSPVRNGRSMDSDKTEKSTQIFYTLNESSNTTESSAFQSPKSPKFHTTAQSSENNKLIKITCIIILVFILCHVPFFTIAIFTNIHPEMNLNLNDIELFLITLASRLIYVNNVCNPFIYGILDKRFIKISKEMYKNCFLCIK